MTPCDLGEVTVTVDVRTGEEALKDLARIQALEDALRAVTRDYKELLYSDYGTSRHPHPWEGVESIASAEALIGDVPVGREGER